MRIAPPAVNHVAQPLVLYLYFLPYLLIFRSLLTFSFENGPTLFPRWKQSGPFSNQPNLGVSCLSLFWVIVFFNCIFLWLFSYCSGSQATRLCDSGCPRVALVTSHKEDPVQTKFASSLVAFWTHAVVHLGLADTSSWYTCTCTICTVCLIEWLPCHTTDTSTNRWQSFLCCRTTCMEQAAQRPETAVVDRLISQKTENILFESDIRICFVMRPLSTGMGCSISTLLLLLLLL